MQTVYTGSNNVSDIRWTNFENKVQGQGHACFPKRGSFSNSDAVLVIPVMWKNGMTHSKQNWVVVTQKKWVVATQKKWVENRDTHIFWVG